MTDATSTIDAVEEAFGDPRRTRRSRSTGGGWPRFLAVKIGAALISLLLVVLLGFFLFRVLPGDPVKTMTANAPVGREQLAELTHRLGLDKSVPAQFVDYLTGLLHGDLGISYMYNEPVGPLVLRALWPTALLLGTGTIIAAALGLWLGTKSAWRRGSRFDKGQTSLALTLWSMPKFWVGLILVTVLGVGVGPIPGLFPVGGMTSPGTPDSFLPQALDVVHHLVLPCVTLVAAFYAQYLLVMRSSLIEEMGADYLMTARAKGLRDALVRRRHAVPNALLPTVTLIFLNLGLVISEAVTIEAVFSWPGLGHLMYEALQVPDLTLLQGTFITLCAMVVVMNLVAEVLYRILDPRVRTS